MDTLFRLVLITSLYAGIAGIIILIIKALLKNRISPKWHYIIWFVLILRLLIPFGPKSVFSVFNVVPKIQQNINFTPIENNYTKPIVAENENYNVSHSVSENQSKAADNQTNQNTPLQTSVSFINIISYIWLSVCIFIMIFLLFAYCLMNQKLKQNKVNIPESINHIFNNCKNKFGINRNMDIMLQNVLNTPAITGVFYPKILLPHTVINLTDKDISYILMHELAHYKRKDIPVNYLLLALQAIHWFNPILWYCFRKMRQDMEIAADEIVLEKLDSIEHKEYGKTLLSMLENLSNTKFIPKLVGMVDDKKNIRKRINMIKMADFFKNKKVVIAITGIVCVLLLGGVLLTNAVAEENNGKNSYEIWDYTLEVPSDWQVENIKVQNNLVGELRFKNDNIEIGGVQRLGYYPEQGPFLPNHSMTKSQKDINNLFTKAVLINLDFQPQPKSSVTQNENHLFLIFESEKISYDIFANTKYVTEDELMKIAKSFKRIKHDDTLKYDSKKLISLKTPYIGNNSAVVSLIDNLPLSKWRNKVSLKTDSRPYGLTVNYNFAAARLSLQEIENILRNNATVLFALIDNVDEINFNAEITDSASQVKSFNYTRTQMQQIYNKDLREFGKNANALDSLITGLNSQMVVYVYPEKYSPAMSGTPGIKMNAFFTGEADKAIYRTLYGQFFIWDSTTGKATSCGKSIESLYNTPVYWIPSPGESYKGVKNFSVSVEVLNGTDIQSKKQINISFDGSLIYTVNTSPDVIISKALQDNTKNNESDSPEQIIEKYIKQVPR